MDFARAPQPFWQRLNTFFAFPFQLRPLGYGALLAAGSLLVHPLGALLPMGLAVLVVELGILLAISRYCFKVTALGARGISRVADYPHNVENEWKSLPWKLFAVVLLQSVAAGFVMAFNEALGVVATFAVSFTLPATMIVLVHSGSAGQALNPLILWGTVRTIGWPYLLLCFFLFLLSTGMQLGAGFVVSVLPQQAVLPLLNAVIVYFSWVMASLLGYVMYQHHDEMGIDLLPGAGAGDAAVDTRSPEQIAQQHLDALVGQMVSDGDLQAALATAYEEQRLHPEQLAAQRRYHKVLLLSDKTPSLVDHGRRLIALLLGRGLSAEALKAFVAIRARDASFALEDGAQTLALARAQWQAGAGDPKATLALLSGFDKRFRGHAAVPEVYALAARVLVQGLQRTDMARPILQTLEARHPDSEQTAEVRWLLRDVPVV